MAKVAKKAAAKADHGWAVYCLSGRRLSIVVDTKKSAMKQLSWMLPEFYGEPTTVRRVTITPAK